jgi:hypothetical protein
LKKWKQSALKQQPPAEAALKHLSSLRHSLSMTMTVWKFTGTLAKVRCFAPRLWPLKTKNIIRTPLETQYLESLLKSVKDACTGLSQCQKGNVLALVLGWHDPLLKDLATPRQTREWLPRLPRWQKRLDATLIVITTIYTAAI